MGISNLANRPELNSKARHGRAVNTSVELFRKRLSIPHIYIEPKGASLRCEVLAVDRAGSGDIHMSVSDASLFSVDPEGTAFQLHLHTDKEIRRPYQASISHLIQRAHALPAHFKYLVLPGMFKNIGDPLTLFDETGIGRIGVISIIEKGLDMPTAELVVQPERFRIDAKKLLAMDRFLKKARPDIEVRI